MAVQQLFFIGTSKAKEIRKGGSVTRWEWGSKDKSWSTFRNPHKKSTTKVKFNKSKKDSKGAEKYGGLGGQTVHGTSIPATVERTISGVARQCEVRYYKRGYTVYTRTAALKRQNKMSKTIYDEAQYRLQYKDKPVIDKDYSEYVDGVEYVYFGKEYFDDDGVSQPTSGHLLHPIEISFSYGDVKRNFNSNANNSDNRDNVGTYVLSNVRTNVMTINLKWAGLTAEDGAELIDTLNPSIAKDKENYLTVQYLDPATNSPKNGTFFASERSVVPFPNGAIKEISVTLVEV